MKLIGKLSVVRFRKTPGTRGRHRAAAGLLITHHRHRAHHRRHCPRAHIVWVSFKNVVIVAPVYECPGRESRSTGTPSLL